MANQVMNIARGRIGYYMADALGLAGANSRMQIIILEVNEADDVLNNHDDLAALIAGANTEATATGYDRTTGRVAAAGMTINIDDTANDAEAVVDSDITYTSVTGNAFTKLLCTYDSDITGGTDANIVPMTHHDFSVTPNGGDITADFDQTNGFWRST